MQNRFMIATLRACATHHKAFNSIIKQLTVRIHIYEAKHGNSMVIGCMDH